MKRIRLFLRIVWRRWESITLFGYHLDTRISAKTAWEVARIVWP